MNCPDFILLKNEIIIYMQTKFQSMTNERINLCKVDISETTDVLTAI